MGLEILVGRSKYWTIGLYNFKKLENEKPSFEIYLKCENKSWILQSEEHGSENINIFESKTKRTKKYNLLLLYRNKLKRLDDFFDSILLGKTMQKRFLGGYTFNSSERLFRVNVNESEKGKMSFENIIWNPNYLKSLV